MAYGTSQLNIQTTIYISQSDILTLSSKPIVVVPRAAGYINVFQQAIITYNFKNTAFTNISYPVGFYLVPTQPDTEGGQVPAQFIVSTTLGGDIVLGSSQITYNYLKPKTPFPVNFSALSNSDADLVFMIGDGSSGQNPSGGDSGSTLGITLTYDVVSR